MTRTHDRSDDQRWKTLVRRLTGLQTLYQAAGAHLSLGISQTTVAKKNAADQPGKQM